MKEKFLGNIESYQKILLKESAVCFFIALLGLSLAIVFFCGLKNYKELKVIVIRIISVIIFLSFFALMLTYSIVLKIDANSNNLLVYEGAYTLYTKRTTTACYMKELNDEKYNVIINTGLIPGTESKYGYVIYTKYAKVVVDYGDY